MRVAIAADHGGFVLKSSMVPWISSLGYEVLDLGAFVFDSSDDYPDFAELVSNSVSSKNAEKGILVCGSGVGASIAANKIAGIRASLCHDTFSAHQGVEHDNMNVICLGGRVIGLELAKDLVEAFLRAQFKGLEKYCRRINKITAIEERSRKMEI